MSLDRRALLGGLTGVAALAAFRRDAMARVADAGKAAAGKKPGQIAMDESYWSSIQEAFEVDRTLINLNNGGCSPAPAHVLDQMIRDVRFSNEIPVYQMWTVLEPRIESCRRELAVEFGCDPEEMAITRNASESLENLIFGIDLKPGDEVIQTNQNYPRMITSWAQRARRDGIVVKQVSFPVPPPSPAAVVDAFRKAITPKTRVIEVTHITNLTGQILPVRDIVRLGREHDIEVFVDGAHAFAHFPFKRDELECDYYATSLHKWLFAPIGTGFLYVRKSKQKKIWPLMAAPPEMDENIRKYEEIGTHPAANHNAIAAAITLNREIGGTAGRAPALPARPLGRPAGRRGPPGQDPDAVERHGVVRHRAHPRGRARHREAAGVPVGQARIMTTPIIHAEFNGSDHAERARPWTRWTRSPTGWRRRSRGIPA
jgi:hypothetical protein